MGGLHRRRLAGRAGLSGGGPDRPEEQGELLTALGASRIVPRSELLEPAKPLEKQLWAGAVDTVGSQVLAKLLAQMNYGGAVAACGLAGGFDLPTSVMPFILRNVRLQGVDSVMCPLARRQLAWQRLARICLPASLRRRSPRSGWSRWRRPPKPSPKGKSQVAPWSNFDPALTGEPHFSG